MSSRLTFSPKAHTYALDGRRVPGVTTVINRCHEKPGMVWAAAREAATWCADHVDADNVTTPAWIREATMAHRTLWDGKRDRGIFLHDAARQLVDGVALTPATDGEPWPDDVVAMAGQLARFMDQWDVDPRHTEVPVFHVDHRWGGTVDALATLRGGRRYLLDYKTGDTGIYPKDALQLAAYRHATHLQTVDPDSGERVDIPMPAVDECACVWIQPDRYELRPVLANDVSYRIFLHMLPVAGWTQWRLEDSVADPLPLPAVAS